MVRFAYLTGWRKTQITRLVWTDIQNGVIRLSGVTVKNKSVQVLSLVGELAELMERRAVVRHPDAPWVFHRDGRPIKDFRYVWKQALHSMLKFFVLDVS